MKKIILFVICVFLSHIAVQAQSEDLFTWANNQVVAKSKFKTIEDSEAPHQTGKSTFGGRKPFRPPTASTRITFNV